MKKVYFVGQLNTRLTLEGGLTANAIDPILGIIGLCPLFSNKRKAEAFAKAGKYPVIATQIHKKRRG